MVNLQTGGKFEVVLGLVLFRIHVDNIVDGRTCEVSKFADAIQIINNVVTSEDIEQIHFDLDHSIRQVGGR